MSTSKSIRAWLLTPFTLLDSPGARWRLILFCGVFGCLFLWLFRPLNLKEWFQDVETPLFLILAFLCGAGMAASLITQLALRSLFQGPGTRLHFFIWLVIDMTVISIAIHVANYFVTGDPIFDWHEYFVTLSNTALVLVLPYSIGLLLLFLREQMRAVEVLTLKIQANQVQQVVIPDENGKVVLSIPARNLLYLKAEDNYVRVVYRLEDAIQNELVRTSLKRLEQSLGMEILVRVHRSYIINVLSLVSARRLPGNSYEAVMDESLRAVVPVSSTYASTFEQKCLARVD